MIEDNLTVKQAKSSKRQAKVIEKPEKTEAKPSLGEILRKAKEDKKKQEDSLPKKEGKSAPGILGNLGSALGGGLGGPKNSPEKTGAGQQKFSELDSLAEKLKGRIQKIK